jgi:hypothetical protein
MAMGFGIRNSEFVRSSARTGGQFAACFMLPALPNPDSRLPTPGFARSNA